MRISESVQKTRQRHALAEAKGTSLYAGPEPVMSPAPTVPIAPGFPPQDIPAGSGLPQRGTMPASTILQSDLSDSTRVFRGGGARSAVYPFPAPNLNTGSAKIATLQAQVSEAQSTSVTASQRASAASDAASSASSTASAANTNASAAQATANVANTTANNALPTPQNLSYR